MKGKRKPNGHQETRGKEAFKSRLDERAIAFPKFDTEFGHLEGDTIVGKNYKSALITLVERTTKAIIVLKVANRKAIAIEDALHQWLSQLPSHFFQTITFDNGKEFSRWKQTANQHDIAIFFADAGKPCQRPLNENSNGILRRNGLPKQMDFNTISQQEINELVSIRNNLPRKSLDYLTPIECFLKHADVSRLIIQFKICKYGRTIVSRFSHILFFISFKVTYYQCISLLVIIHLFSPVERLLNPLLLHAMITTQYMSSCIFSKLALLQPFKC